MPVRHCREGHTAVANRNGRQRLRSRQLAAARATCVHLLRAEGHAMFRPAKQAGVTAVDRAPPTTENGSDAFSFGDQSMKFRSFLGLAGAAAISLGLVSGAFAEDKVIKIGGVFPMTGNAASAGVHAKAAIEVALDIINNAHPELGNFPLAKNAGLAGLGGAKVEVVFADNQGSPATGQNQALRLITEEKVVAITGAYQSGITLTTSAIAEKYGIPYLNGESVAANLTERGFKWFFRTTPIATDFAKVFQEFLADMKAQGAKVDSIALVHDNTEYGTSVATTLTTTFKEKGFGNLIDVAYASNATDVQSQVLQLKEKKPDVVLMISYTSDAILFAKTMQARS